MNPWRQPLTSNVGFATWLLTGAASLLVIGLFAALIWLVLPTVDAPFAMALGVLAGAALVHLAVSRRVSRPWLTAIAVLVAMGLLVLAFNVVSGVREVRESGLLLPLGLGVLAERLWASNPRRFARPASRLVVGAVGLLLAVGLFDRLAGLVGVALVIASLLAPLHIPAGGRYTIAVLSASATVGLGAFSLELGADAFTASLVHWLAFFSLIVATFVVVRRRPRHSVQTDPKRLPSAPHRASTVATYIAMPLVATFLIFAAVEIDEPQRGAEPRIPQVAAAGFLLVGALAMVAGWRMGDSSVGEAMALFGGWVWTLFGFVLPDPPTWSLLPAFLLPWLLLLVELPARQRLLLLLFQWLSTAILYETLTQESVGTVLLFGLGLLHVVLVGAGMQGRWMQAAVLVGVALSLVILVTSLVFALRDPTARRFLWVAAGLVVLAVTSSLLYTGALSRLRPPTLVRKTTANPDG